MGEEAESRRKRRKRKGRRIWRGGRGRAEGKGDWGLRVGRGKTGKWKQGRNEWRRERGKGGMERSWRGEGRVTEGVGGGLHSADCFPFRSCGQESDAELGLNFKSVHQICSCSFPALWLEIGFGPWFRDWFRAWIWTGRFPGRFFGRFFFN